MIYGDGFCKFNNGRVVIGVSDILSLPHDLDCILEGYDSTLWNEWDNELEFTDDELIEIADYQIQQWNKFKKKLTNSGK